MAVSDQIERIKTNIANAYATAETMGATMPETQNSENLSATIGSITGGDSATQQLGIIFDDVNNIGQPRQITINYAEGELKPLVTGNTSGWGILQKIIINEGPTSLASNSLVRLNQLRAVKIPASVTELGYLVFNQDTNLEFIIFEGTEPPTFQSDTFANTKVVNETGIIFVPDESLGLYQAALDAAGAAYSIGVDSISSLPSWDEL